MDIRKHRRKKYTLGTNAGPDRETGGDYEEGREHAVLATKRLELVDGIHVQHLSEEPSARSITNIEEISGQEMALRRIEQLGFAVEVAVEMRFQRDRPINV